MTDPDVTREALLSEFGAGQTTEEWDRHEALVAAHEAVVRGEDERGPVTYAESMAEARAASLAATNRRLEAALRELVEHWGELGPQNEADWDDFKRRFLLCGAGGRGEGVGLLRFAKRRGLLWTPCRECGQRMVVARSGKQCLNCL